jgi:hypothetical protein
MNIQDEAHPKYSRKVNFKDDLLVTSRYETIVRMLRNVETGKWTYMEKPRRTCSRCRLTLASMARSRVLGPNIYGRKEKFSESYV